MFELLTDAVSQMFDFIADFFNGVQTVPLLGIPFIVAAMNLFRRVWRKIRSSLR